MDPVLAGALRGRARRGIPADLGEASDDDGDGHGVALRERATELGSLIEGQPDVQDQPVRRRSLGVLGSQLGVEVGQLAGDQGQGLGQAVGRLAVVAGRGAGGLLGQVGATVPVVVAGGPGVVLGLGPGGLALVVGVASSQGLDQGRERVAVVVQLARVDVDPEPVVPHVGTVEPEGVVPPGVEEGIGHVVGVDGLVQGDAQGVLVDLVGVRAAQVDQGPAGGAAHAFPGVVGILALPVGQQAQAREPAETGTLDGLASPVAVVATVVDERPDAGHAGALAELA